ncbi:hypothetical protein ACFGVS_23895 [Mucilaginibacter sp. AW1-7]|uniref:hypothetical protein n=1 Tax=Mucilaginibacter sp. AW1-7 TaxID=3349874 RepID=UPI003F73DE4D
MSKHYKPYTPEEVIEILKKHDPNITLEKAKLILDAMRKLAKLTLEQEFNI